MKFQSAQRITDWGSGAQNAGSWVNTTPAPTGLAPIGYIGWDNDAILSAKEREEVFRRQKPAPAFVHKIPWNERSRLDQISANIASGLTSSINPPRGIICGDGEIGVAVKKALDSHGLDSIALASLDEYPESRGLSIHAYRQDFQRMAEKTYECLAHQNRSAWIASTYRIKGDLVNNC